MQNAESQRRAMIDGLMLNVSQSVFANIVGRFATPMKPNELREAAKYAIETAPYFLEQMGLVTITEKVTEQPLVEPAA
jgi:hypothetical protein